MRVRQLWRTNTRFQDAVTAAATLAAGLVLNLVGLTMLWPSPAEQPNPGWHHLTLLGGCLVMLGKRRHPMAALAAGTAILAVDALLGGSIAVILVMFDLLFSAALFASDRARTALTTGAFVLTGTASVVGGLAAGQVRFAVFICLQLVTLLLVPLWWAANIRQQRQLGDLAAREAVVAERAAMARDLHDVIAAHLTTTAMHSGAALARPPDTGRDRAALQAVRASSLAALEEMRSMILLLRADDPAPRDPSLPGGLDRLPDLAAAAAGGLRVDTHVVDVPVPAVVAQTVYRIVGEALTNAGKHAPGSSVRLDVRPDGDRLTVTVSNTMTSGNSIDHEALSAGTGLLSIRERATLLGGELTAGRDGDHWTVQATLPLRGDT
ncbi:histidine kinase [Actinoplanes sp. NPDC049802]|uniref:sensor histidine kinase n=1 Tax=Actinoplanes sp. NPDC049802 TaxID=3154742 RepID=UPI0033D9D9AE